MRVLQGMLMLAVLTAIPGVATAETVRERQEKACQADAYKFCKDAIPDEDKIAECMGQHRKQLSVNCGLMYDRGLKN